MADVCMGANRAVCVQRRRIDVVAEQLGVVVGICEQHVLQMLARILQVVLDVTLAAVVMERVRNGVQITQGRAVVVANDVVGIIVVLIEIIRMRLNVQTDAALLHNRNQLVQRPHELCFAQLRIVSAGAKLSIEHANVHQLTDFEHLLPAVHRVLTNKFVRILPVETGGQRRNLQTGVGNCLFVPQHFLLGYLRTLPKAREVCVVRIDVFIACASNRVVLFLICHAGFPECAAVKCDFHKYSSSVSLSFKKAWFPSGMLRISEWQSGCSASAGLLPRWIPDHGNRLLPRLRRRFSTTARHDRNRLRHNSKNG